MNCRQPLGLISLILLFPAQGLAQGPDCSNPTTIATNTLSTYAAGQFSTSGFTGGGTCASLFLEFDSFWLWTAPANGDYLVEFLGADFDMAFRVHTGNDCAAACIATGFDSFNMHPQVGLTAVSAGDQFLIQAGVTNSADGMADLLISPVATPCSTIGPDAFEPNESCNSPAPLSLGTYSNLNVSLTSSDYYSVVVPPGETLQVMETHDPFQSIEYTLRAANCLSNVAFGPFGLDWANATGSPQTMILRAVIPSSAPFDCSTYGMSLSLLPDPCQTAPDDAFEPNDTCMEASSLPDGTYSNLFVSRSDRDHYAICVKSGATFSCSVSFPFLGADLDILLHDAAGLYCTTNLGSGSLVESSTFANPETLTWTNLSGIDRSLILEIRVRNLISNEDCNVYNLTLSGGDDCAPFIGTPFCDPMDPNSIGLSTRLAGQFDANTGTGLHLSVTQGPPTQFGFLLVGSASTEPGVTISAGRLCLDTTGGNAIGRYNQAGTDRNSLGAFHLTGVFANLSNTGTGGFGFNVPATLPLSGNPMIQAGQTWHFQAWHRQPLGESNFSNGLSVVF